MKTLQQILMNEKNFNMIHDHAKLFRFENVQIFFEGAQNEQRLNLVVDIGESGISKITDSVNQKIILNSVVSIEGSDDKIEKIAQQSLKNIKLNLPQIGRNEIVWRLQSAHKILDQSDSVRYSLSP